MPAITIKNETILSDEKYTLKRFEYDVQMKNGSTQTQNRQVLNHGDAATVLLYNKESRTVILTKQFRMATYVNQNSSGMLIETPAGLMNKNESPEETIIREIKEETGYAVSNVQKLFEGYSSPGILTEMIYYFAAPYSKEQKTGEGGGLKEEGEEVQVMELPFDEALQMIERGEIRDTKTILLLYTAQVKGLL